MLYPSIAEAKFTFILGLPGDPVQHITEPFGRIYALKFTGTMKL